MHALQAGLSATRAKVPICVKRPLTSRSSVIDQKIASRAMLPVSGLGSSLAPGLPLCAQEQLHLLI